YRIYRWLEEHKDDLRLKVKSIRLLLASSAAEKAAEPALQTLATPVPTWQAFKDAAWEWRTAASNNLEDITFFYFAGHGLQRSPEEGILVLADFAEPQTSKLSRCVSFGEVRNGMALTDEIPLIAQTQFYFVDACRVRPSDALNKLVNPRPAEIWDVLLPTNEKRAAPVLFSTVDNAIALGRDGQTTYFAEGLLLALDNAAEDPDDSNDGPPVWPVTSTTLKTALDNFYARHKVGTRVTPGGWQGAPILRYLPGPPDVDVEIFLRPDLLTGDGKIVLCDDDWVPLHEIAPCPTIPIQRRIKAGIYRLSFESPRITASPYKSKSKALSQRAAVWPHDLSSRFRPGDS
ncbi:MAG: hypothetical protein QOC84_1463, partial [Bradyrhizobium sp.]|nr:hypothetical protein [Bradyrhizobium sp.]